MLLINFIFTLFKPSIVANPILSTSIDIFTLKLDRQEKKKHWWAIFLLKQTPVENFKQRSIIFLDPKVRFWILVSALIILFFFSLFKPYVATQSCPYAGRRDMWEGSAWSCFFEARFVVNRFNTKATTLGPSCWKPEWRYAVKNGNCTITR